MSDDDDLASIYGLARKRRAAEEEPEDENGGIVRRFILPLILLGIGGTILFFQIQWVEPEIPKRVVYTPMTMMFIVSLAVVIALGALLLASKWLEYTIGDLNTAVFKIASVAVFATSLALPMLKFDKSALDLTGFSMGWSFMLIAYWVFVPILFKLELNETLLTVGMIVMTDAVIMGVVLAQ